MAEMIAKIDMDILDAYFAYNGDITAKEIADKVGVDEEYAKMIINKLWADAIEEQEKDEEIFKELAEAERKAEEYEARRAEESARRNRDKMRQNQIDYANSLLISDDENDQTRGINMLDAVCYGCIC